MPPDVLCYFRSYLLDLKSPNAQFTIEPLLPMTVIIDPAISYYRAYLGRI
jgi:hypothetical protein